MTEPTPVVLPLIAEAVKKGQCILFLGAGVHYPPPDGSEYSYPEEHRPPLGSALSRQLAAKSGFATRFPDEAAEHLQRVAQHFECQFKRQPLIAEVRSAVGRDKKPSPVVQALARLNFPLVITTNYDRLFERALSDAGKDPAVSVYKPNLSNQDETDEYPGRDDPTAAHPFILKLHGDVDQPDSIVITDEDYIQFVLRMSDKDPFHPVPLTFRVRFKRWPTLFVGYSLMDYNLRLLFKTLRWGIDFANMPPTYAVDRSPDPLIRDVWESKLGYVTYIVQDIWAFVPELYRLVTGQPMPHPPLLPGDAMPPAPESLPAR